MRQSMEPAEKVRPGEKVLGEMNEEEKRLFSIAELMMNVLEMEVKNTRAVMEIDRLEKGVEQLEGILNQLSGSLERLGNGKSMFVDFRSGWKVVALPVSARRIPIEF